jgi:hypothetical protein
LVFGFWIPLRWAFLSSNTQHGKLQALLACGYELTLVVVGVVLGLGHGDLKKASFWQDRKRGKFKATVKQIKFFRMDGWKVPMR